ncbi:conserved hypothetical protein [Theileria equi strain WA]|uniref:Serine aminopeptidase S33 domain-containing protein n=1 Tax=Theileria equi strain WA TaxID=1537102 RepID=L1LD03_THEEQ|nr:conserved hypothetical protein [Theileria equi strain WA]EKX73297.1 conserved hypothetical protein [Theileria equi strain WA]|eukprot:XP_004832749.1 conserved hypothetical protein [Theileria equi strain WA]
MIRFVTLFILNLTCIGLCRRSEVPGNGVVLDITNPDGNKIETLTRSPYEILTKVYIARDGHRVISVEDGGEKLWTLTGEHLYEHSVVAFDEKSGPIFAFISLKDGSGLKSGLYYEKKDRWTEVTEEKFFKSFHRVVLRVSTSRTFVLETEKDYQYREFYINKSSKFPFAVYAANSIARLKGVRCEGSVVWNATSEDERCIYASFYPRDEHKLAYLMVDDGEEKRDIYLHNFFGLWVPITKDVYLEELISNGFDPSKFDDRITLDMGDINKEQFHMHVYMVHGNYTRLITPLPGYKLTRVVLGDDLIWEAADGKHCIYLNSVTEQTEPLALFMFVEDPTGSRKILYFKREDDGWVEVNREGYYNPIVDDNSPIYTHKGDGNVIMSSFRNKQGLRIATYASRVENAKGDIILIHGFRSFFMSEFCAFNINWNFEHLNFPYFPHNCTFSACNKPRGVLYIGKYKRLFEYGSLNGLNAFEVTPRYEYDYSVVYFLNKLGYNVYAMDNQSQGLSEAISDLRCYVNNFKDYIYDLLQFVSIVKRSKFDDPSETFDESSLYENIPTDRKIFLLGFSMGANISIQAIQDFHKNAKTGTKFVDAFIGFSAMLNLDCHAYDWTRVLAFYALKVAMVALPDTKNPREFLLNYGESFDFFIRFKDPFHHSGGTAFKTLGTLFKVCDELDHVDNMQYYPRDLPTIFFHSKEDFMSGIKGPRNFIDRHFKGNKNFKLIELDGPCHYLTVYQAMSTIMPSLRSWFDELPGKLPVHEDDLKSDEF